MPRTKRPTRNVEKTGEDDDALKKLNKQVIDLKNKVDSRANMELRNVELAFKILLGSISANLLQKTVGQLKTELHFKDTTTHSSRSASHDDGYLTENSSQGSGERHAKKTFLAPPSTVRARRSRSADASCRSVRGISTTGRSTTASTAGRRRSRSVYRTPAYNKNAALNYPPITPKVDPQTPLTVLRQPRQGEMVVSMSGSPVMVPACYSMQPSEKATCNILLRDGTTLSLQPKQLRQSQAYIPFTLMDSRVLDQLRTLKDNLDKVVKLGEKVIVQ
ncbi:uncharacterized protein LOC116775379 isoform X1 [Danaus plexippus]|uniref:uncharacterized protein LOC116775379 isoform X1 n=1 Tax=Danaus plexippus TaxID=13037 RepID=UPI002AAFB2B7|nr:uncharacterized protein LOC116775379 isoform X1 [Danaus plexippus]